MSFMLRVPAWDTMWVSWVSTVKLCATLQPSLTMFPVASMYHLMLMPPKCRPLTSGLRIIPRVRAYLHQSMCRLLRLWETSIPLRYLLGWTTSASWIASWTLLTKVRCTCTAKRCWHTSRPILLRGYTKSSGRVKSMSWITTSRFRPRLRPLRVLRLRWQQVKPRFRRAVACGFR